MINSSKRSSLSNHESFAAFVIRMRAIGVNDQRIFAAIENAQRKDFIDSQWSHLVYTKRSLPIDCGEYIEGIDEQTRYLAQLQLEPTSRVLEIGTGSGFTAAVMAQISARVMTLDRYKKLCDEARIRLQKLKIENVNIKYADARNNIPGGPFDRIIAWVAYEELPLHLVDMLATHGVIIAPVGPGDGLQAMMKLSKVGSRFEKEVLGNVRYQPFIEGTSSFF